MLDATPARRNLLRTYATVLRDEPAIRTYLLASIVDDVGIAVSAWGIRLMLTNLFTDQRQRAKLMLPLLVCFLVGSIVAGPLADWVRHRSPVVLGRWRWRVVVWGRVIETLALGLAILGVASGHPTIAGVMPYFVISALMKTGLRPTRIAFEVDLLRREQVQVDADGVPLLDERGDPRVYKIHLLSFTAAKSFLGTAATLGWLLLGGIVLRSVHGRYAPLFVFDVITNLGFIALVLYGCHPERGIRKFRLRELFRDIDADASDSVRGQAAAAGRSIFVTGLREFGTSLREAIRFLRHPSQRPLCWFLLGAWVIEVVNEFYDGRMIVRHTLHGSDDAVRYGEIAWSTAEIVVLALIPILARRVGSLGKIFLITMLVDGVAIMVAGRIALAGVAASILPFAGAIAMDRGLTSASQSLVQLAQNSASSPAIRGRIAASWAFVVILSDMVAEALSTTLTEKYGIPRMLMRVGGAQVALMLVVVIVGGRGLWTFGLRSTERASHPPKQAEVAAAAA